MNVDLEKRVAELRAEFDRAFADSVAETQPEFLDVILLTVAGDRYALRFADVTGVHAGRAVSPVPTSSRVFSGLMGLRGVIVPTYDLAGLLGYPAAERPRWVISLRHATSVGVAFDRLDAHRRVALSDVKNQGGAADDSRPTRGGIIDAGATIPLIHLPSLLEIIERARSKPPTKGR